MTKITPHLWYDKEAKEAAALYISAFKNSAIKNHSVISGSPSGDVDILTIDLVGQEFMLISAGPYFKLNPSVSFLVACETKAEVDELWAKLGQDGKVLMPLGSYPFSEHYGWTQDKFGLSWQIMHMGHIPWRQKITPTLMFVGNVCGRAEEAMNFYTSIFTGHGGGETRVADIMRYGVGEEPDKSGTVKHGAFVLAGLDMGAMDSAHAHEFSFNEAVSFIVNCRDQAEIDYFWEKLSAVPAAEQCGWLKDKFGLSWQIVPVEMNEMMSGDQAKVDRVTQAFLKMKKLDIAELRRAAKGLLSF